MNAVWFMGAGVALAALGGDLFVRGIVNLAAWWRIPAGIIGVTIAAFATSAPELSVAVNAASAGQPAIALGDALGSNVVNLGLVLGIALLFGTIHMPLHVRRQEMPMALAAPLLLGLLLTDGALGRADGWILIAVFVGWLARTVLVARRMRDDTVAVLRERSRTVILVSVSSGLLLLVAAGRLIVSGAADLTTLLGWDAFVIGVVIVAVGTSTPEIATALVSRLRHHDEVAVSTVLGSNIFNTLLIVGIASVITPIQVASAEAWIGIGASIGVVALLVTGRSGQLHRWRSIPLFAVFLSLVLLVT